MRRAYQDTIRRIFSKKGPGRLTPSILLKILSAYIRPSLSRPLAPPIFATLEVTRHCNLQCTFCESHEGHALPRLNDWMKDFIHETGRAGVTGIGFTGGEPLLLNSFESLADAAAQAGLLAHLNTNGTLVDRSRAVRLLETGLGSINVSLDSADPDIHDRLRGRGSFTRTRKGIEALVHARASSGTGTRLLLALTLSDNNASRAPDLVPLARELGVDGCTFLPCSSFSPPGGRVRAPSAARAATALHALCNEQMVDNSRRYLKGMIRYFEGARMPGRCSALHSSILVSSERKLYPCVPSNLRGSGGVPYRPGELMESFHSGILQGCLDDTLCSECWWNCHRELDLALGVI